MPLACDKLSLAASKCLCSLLSSSLLVITHSCPRAIAHTDSSPGNTNFPLGHVCSCSSLDPGSVMIPDCLVPMLFVALSFTALPTEGLGTDLCDWPLAPSLPAPGKVHQDTHCVSDFVHCGIPCPIAVPAPISASVLVEGRKNDFL